MSLETSPNDTTELSKDESEEEWKPRNSTDDFDKIYFPKNNFERYGHLVAPEDAHQEAITAIDDFMFKDGVPNEAVLLIEDNGDNAIIVSCYKAQEEIQEDIPTDNLYQERQYRLEIAFERLSPNDTFFGTYEHDDENRTQRNARKLLDNFVFDGGVLPKEAVIRIKHFSGDERKSTFDVYAHRNHDPEIPL